MGAMLPLSEVTVAAVCARSPASARRAAACLSLKKGCMMPRALLPGRPATLSSSSAKGPREERSTVGAEEEEEEEVEVVGEAAPR